MKKVLTGICNSCNIYIVVADITLRATRRVMGRGSDRGDKKYFKKVLDKLNNLRYYIKADSHSGLTKSLQSFYKPLMKERQCSLKTKQCNRNHAHMISSQMLDSVSAMRMQNINKQDLCEQNLKFHYMDNFESHSGSSIYLLESLILAQDERWRRA